MFSLKSAVQQVKRLTGRPAKVEARLREALDLIEGTNRVVLELNQVVVSINNQLGELGPAATSQTEAVAFLNRTLRNLSDRVGALETALHS